MTHKKSFQKASSPLKQAIILEQLKLLIFAEAVLQKIPADCQRVMGVKGSEDTEELLLDKKRQCRWLVNPASRKLLRAALACSETSLTLGSLLARASGKSVAVVNGELQAEGSPLVSNKYIAGRIAGHAVLPEEAALALWKAIVEVLAEGKHHLPGVSTKTEIVVSKTPRAPRVC